MVKTRLFFPSLALVALLTACAGGGGTRTTTVSPESSADTIALETASQYQQEGKFLDAALIYNRLAGRYQPPLKQEMQLRSAQALIAGGYVLQAAQLLNDVDNKGMNDFGRTLKLLLSAEIEIARGNPEAAGKYLNRLLSPGEDLVLRQKFWKLRADSWTLLGNQMEAARAHIQLDTLLEDVDARARNQLALLQALARLPEHRLSGKNAPREPVLRAWIELSQISRSAAFTPASIGDEVAQWKRRHPQVTLVDNVIDTLLYRDKEKLELPTQIALLLPLEGPFKGAASAVRDGFLGAWYSNNREDFQPSVRIYNTGAAAERIRSIYEQAGREGAQMIVGPLHKEAVNALARSDELSIPVLALNYASTEEAYRSNFFQFGLSPEDEAVQVAERAWLDGYQHPLVLHPNNPWGKRVALAFQDRWEQLGGRILEVLAYDPNKNDFSDPIRSMLNLDESDQRRRALSRLFGEVLEHTPRRRQDADFIFLSGEKEQARQIVPQLRFHHAGDLPVYSTSHVFAGVVSRKDRDLNGLRFGDMPWVLPGKRKTDALKQSIQKAWPTESARHMRFYALGIDAFNLIVNMNQLLSVRSSSADGETGQLFVDDQNRVYRRINWVYFKNGVPVPLDKN